MNTLQTIEQGFYGKNGVNTFYHRINKKSIYSDGLLDFMKQANSLWLYDIIETEVFSKAKTLLPDVYYLSISVTEGKCLLILRDYQGSEIWSRTIKTFGVPEGKITIRTGWDGQNLCSTLRCED